MNMRNRIDKGAVLDFLGTGKSSASAARQFKCSESYIRQIKLYHKRENMRRCSCCGINPVAPGKRFLCRSCFSTNVHHRENQQISI